MHSPLQLPRQLVWPDHTQEDFRRMLPREAFETLLEMYDIVIKDEDELPEYVDMADRQVFISPADFFNEARYLATVLSLWSNPDKLGSIALCERLVGRIDFGSRTDLKLGDYQLLLLNMVSFLSRISLKHRPDSEQRHGIIYETITRWEAQEESTYLIDISTQLRNLHPRADNIGIAPLLPQPTKPQLLSYTNDWGVVAYVHSIRDGRDFERLLCLYHTKEDQQALLEWVRQSNIDNRNAPGAETSRIYDLPY